MLGFGLRFGGASLKFGYAWGAWDTKFGETKFLGS